MGPETRDPRIDPRPGDVVRHRSGRPTRTVEIVKASGMVSVSQPTWFVLANGRRQLRWGRPDLAQWRRWARDGEAMEVAP